MPLPPAHPKGKYSVIFVTGGPWPPSKSREDVRNELQSLVRSHFTTNLKQCLIALEVGEGGYHHFHIALHLTKEVRWCNLNTKIRKLLTSWPKEDDRDVSTRFNYVPVQGEMIRKGGTKGKANLRGFEVLEAYLKTPKKVKETDDGALGMDQVTIMEEEISHLGFTRDELWRLLCAVAEDAGDHTRTDQYLNFVQGLE